MLVVWRTFATFLSVSFVVVASNNNCSKPNMTSSLYIYRTSKGATTTQLSYKHGDWLFFRCKNNGQLIGTFLRFCRSGLWSGTQPFCRPKATPKPPVRCQRIRSLKHGKVRGRRRSVNDVVRFSCVSGYNLMGARKLTCLTTGSWSGQVPRCLKDVSCPNPGKPRNGDLHGTKFKYGRRVRYSCNTGYKLVGSMSRECMSNGRWTGKRVKCVKTDPASELKEVADNLRKNMVNKFGLVTVDSRARAGISSGASGLDFVFVLDSSASVGKTNFRRGIEFVQTIIKTFGVSTKPQGTRVAIVTFNAVAEIRFNLATNVMNDTDQAMKKLGNIQFQGGGTNTEAALSKVFHGVSPEARAGSHKVLFLITDGRSNAGTNPRHFAQKLRERNYEIFAIGITKNADKDELKSIASQPYRSHIHLLADYVTLEKLKDKITGKGQDKWECGQAGDTGLRGRLKTPDRKLSRDDAWPWQAIIYVDAAFTCGGALVANDWVLTAARCFNKKVFEDSSVYNDTIKSVKVVLGEHDRFAEAGTEQNYEVKKLIHSPRAGKNRRDDLVMIKLKYAIKPTAYVHAVCYDEDPQSSLIWPTQYGVVTGWGSRKRIKNNTVTIPAFDELQQTVVKFMSDRECGRKSKKGSVFCGSSRDDGVTECLGDTGGPVVVKLVDDSWTLVGVMKSNEGCTADSKHSTFIKVGRNSAWISETILKK